MKIKGLLIGMLACTALVGCTNSDEPEVNNGNNEELANSYLAVRIADANVASRGIGGDYDEGDAGERTIVDADFFFYSADGRFIALVEKSFTEQTQNDGNVSDEATVLVLEKTQLSPATLVTLINNPIEAQTLRTLDLNGMKAKVAEITEIANYANNGKFFMTTSSYYDGTKAVYGTDVLNKLKTSKTDAANAPVDVYVERIAAKANVKFEATQATIPSQIVNEAEQTITVKLKGWGLNGKNKDSYLVKNLNNINFTNYSWAVPTGVNKDYRSYWAVDNNYTAGEYATIYKDLLTADDQGNYSDLKEDGTFDEAAIDETKFDLDYISANEANLVSEATAYCLENTSNTLLEVNKKNPFTTVTIIAEIILQGNSTAETVYKYEGGYYTESSLKALALKTLKDYRKASGNEYIALDANDIKFVDAWADSNNEVKFEVAGEKYYTGSDTENMTEHAASSLNTALATLGNAKCFTNGLCGYTIPVEHLNNTASTTENNGVYGMVRNHSYLLTVKKIENVGEAIYKPGAPIIPTTQPTPVDYYLQTTLKVLSWKTVSQDVNL